FAVALDDIGVGPPLEYAQPGIELARRAFVQCLHEGARGRLGPVSREHRFLEVVTGRLVVLDAILLEPPTQLLVCDRRHLEARIDDAEHLEDHALADGRIALVDSKRKALAIEHLVVEPDSTQRVQLCFVGFPAARCLEHLSCLAIHLGVHQDRAWIVGPADERMVERKEQPAQHEEMHEWLAHPAWSMWMARGKFGLIRKRGRRRHGHGAFQAQTKVAKRERRTPSKNRACGACGAQLLYLTPATVLEPVTSM